MRQSCVLCLICVYPRLQFDDLIIVYLVKLLLVFFDEVLSDAVESEPISHASSSFCILAAIPMISSLDVLSFLRTDLDIVLQRRGRVTLAKRLTFPVFLFGIHSIQKMPSAVYQPINKLIMLYDQNRQSRAILRLLLPGLEILIIGETADLLEVLNDGQFGLHFHFGAQDLLDEVLGFIEVLAERVELGILEQGLEAVYGDARVAEGLHLFDLVFAQLMDYCSFLQEFGGFSMQVLAEVLGLEAVALLDLGSHVERSCGDLEEFGELVLTSRLTVVFLVLEAESVGGDLYFRGNGFSIIVSVLQALKQAGSGLDQFLALHSMLLFKPEKVHFRLREAKLVALFPQSLEPITTLRLRPSVKLIREIIVHKTLVRHYFYQYKPSVPTPQQILKTHCPFYYAGKLVEWKQSGEGSFKGVEKDRVKRREGLLGEEGLSAGRREEEGRSCLEGVYCSALILF